VISVSTLANGQANINPEINCELTSPGIDACPSRLLSKGSIGLRSKEPLKTKIEGSGARAATGIMKRNVAPDSPQSMGCLAFVRGLAPVIVQQFSAVATVAPKAVMARRVAWVSSDRRGLDILEIPSHRAAAMSILCVKDFDGGAQTSPFNRLLFLMITSAID
jgi:hypothetical protein